MHRSLHVPIALVVIGLTGVLPGCASLDPAADVARAADLVGQRAGTTPAWSEPWADRASSWDGAAPLDAETAVALALVANRAVRADLETIGAARADLVEAGYLPNPMLAASVGFPIGNAPGTSVGVGVMQQFTALIRRPARMRGAEARLEAQVLAVSDRALTLVQRVRSAHARVVFAQRAAALADELVGAYEGVDRLTAARVGAGEGSELDLNRARLPLLKARAEQIKRDVVLASAKRELLELIGRAGSSADWIAAEPAPGVVSKGITEDEAQTLAFRQRLDIAMAVEEAYAAREELRVAGVDRLPEVAAGGMIQREMGGGRMAGPQIEVELPVFDSGRAGQARAAAGARRAQFEAQRVAEAALREVRVAWQQADAGRRAWELFRDETLELSVRNEILVRMLGESGEADRAAELSAAADHLEARLMAADLEEAYVLGLIELERAAGGTLRTIQP